MTVLRVLPAILLLLVGAACATGPAASTQAPAGAATPDPSVLLLLPTEGRTLAPGASVTDTLGPADYLLTGGDRVKGWTLALTDTTTLRIDLESEDIDPILRLAGPGMGEALSDDDGGDGLNSRLCLTLAPGEYVVAPGSLYGSTGPFTLTLSVGRVEDGCSGGIQRPRTDRSPDQMSPQGELALGSEAEAVLGGDVWWRERASELWLFTPAVSGEYTVAMDSEDFDAYLEVIGAGIEDSTTDDDGGCGTDARLTLALQAGETYQIVTSSLFESLGAYTVRVVEDESELPDCDFGFDYVPDTFDLEGVPSMGLLRIGESAEGILDEYSYWIAEGYGDHWRLRGEGGTPVAITVDADFDPVVVLLGPGIDGYLEDDDGGEGVNSRLCTVLPESGEYSIVVRGFAAEPEGSYLVSVAPIDSAEECSGQFDGGLGAELREEFRQEALAEARAMPSAGRIEGTLDARSGVRGPDDGRLYAPVRATLPAGDEVFVEIRGDFDSYLRILGPEGEDWTDDDGACGTLSRISITPEREGEYLILAASLFDRESPLDWAVTLGSGPGSCLEGVDEFPVSGRLELGVLVESRLREGMPLSDRDVEVEVWEFEAEAGGRYVFDLSAEFDTYLHLVGPDGATEWRNDDGGCRLDSRIVLEDAAPGVYRVLASALQSLGPDESGYALSVALEERACSAVPRPSGGAPAPDRTPDGVER